MDRLDVEDRELAVATDLYQLTMMAAYHARGALGSATFELFVRQLPPNRAFLVAAGLEQALAYLTSLRFSEEGIAWLRSLPVFAHVSPSFFEYLADFRFEGDVDAIPEGTVVFPEEPLLRVRASLPAAQLVETYLLATINAQTLIASKAARVRIAARDKRVTDFGARRAHGFGAAMLAARASWIAGLDGTSNVLAARRLGIPVVGTAAHAFIMSYEREEDAFAAYHALYPDHCILLVDTYDTVEGCRRAVQTVGPTLRGVRLDSGDLATLSRECRRVLDEAGAQRTAIVASGDLDETKIDALLAAGAPIDGFGVGTELVTSRDQPAIAGVYKLVEREDAGRTVHVMKRSTGKATWPGAKQVYRFRRDGEFERDVIELASARPAPNAEPLLVPVMRGGRVVASHDVLSLESARARCAREIASLPSSMRALRDCPKPPVSIGRALQDAAEALRGGR